MIAGRHVFDVGAIATRFKVNVADKCWPTLLSTKTPPHNASLCLTPSAAGHDSPTTAAHAHPQGFDAAAILAEFGKAPTPAQQKRAGANSPRPR
eukprot:3963349-Pleurochrysis_carterae.AAC.1